MFYFYFVEAGWFGVVILWGVYPAKFCWANLVNSGRFLLPSPVCGSLLGSQDSHHQPVPPAGTRGEGRVPGRWGAH